MKKLKKENLIGLIPTFIIIFVCSFMLFIYEPIVTYASNISDYWFDFSDLLKVNLLAFTVFVVCGCLFFFFLYLLSVRVLKKKKIFNIVVIILFSLFLSLYIQGNYMSGSLPQIDGAKIIWNQYLKENIISILIWGIPLIINIFLMIFIKKNNYIKYTSFISGAVFVMLLTSLVSVMLTTDGLYSPKGTFIPLNTNINNISSNNNLMVLIVDAADSREFHNVVSSNNYKDVFEDFTYFPDTLSTYPFTKESIPYILSGQWYEAEKNYLDYYTDAMNNSKLIELLNKNDYDINIYEEELSWNDNKASKIDNIKEEKLKIKKMPFYRQEIKYILFKYLPYPLKKYSKIESLNYNLCKGKLAIDGSSNKAIFSPNNLDYYNLLSNKVIQDDNYFQFVHIVGAHFPYNLNKDLETIEDGTYDDQIEASIQIIKKYLNTIKNSGYYDQTAIIIMSDHGYNGYEFIGRQNPILYIKGFNEHHELKISDKKVSYVDLNDSIYEDLINHKKSDELLSDIDNNRIRRFLWYRDYDDMYEQTLDGHAWETDKLVDTGNRYTR